MNILLTTLISLVMTYEMPKLPYANNGLEPVISQATIDYHYGKPKPETLLCGGI